MVDAELLHWQQRVVRLELAVSELIRAVRVTGGSNAQELVRRAELALRGESDEGR